MSFFQQLLQRHTFTLPALLVENYTEGGSIELELGVKELPFFVRHVDVLALDVVLLQPLFGRFTRTVFLVADIKETYWKVFHLLHPLALFQHVSPAGTAVHPPEMDLKDIPLIGCNDAFEDGVALRRIGDFL